MHINEHLAVLCVSRLQKCATSELMNARVVWERENREHGYLDLSQTDERDEKKSLSLPTRYFCMQSCILNAGFLSCAINLLTLIEKFEDK